MIHKGMHLELTKHFIFTWLPSAEPMLLQGADLEVHPGFESRHPPCVTSRIKINTLDRL